MRRQTAKRLALLLPLLAVTLACSLTGVGAPAVTETPAMVAQAPTVTIEEAAQGETPQATPTRLSDEFMEPLDVEEQLVTNLYERVGPAVVHITTRVTNLNFFLAPCPARARGRASSSTVKGTL